LQANAKIRERTIKKDVFELRESQIISQSAIKSKKSIKSMFCNSSC
jgi:hypothetical protein